MNIQAFVFHAWMRTIAFAVFGRRAFVLKVGDRPTGANRINEMFFADETRVRAVTAIEGNAFPVDKRTRCRGGETHRIVIINHPRTTFAHTTWAFVETNGNGLLRDVFVIHFQRPKQGRPEVHLFIRRS